jgi:hypothetical protein
MFQKFRNLGRNMSLKMYLLFSHSLITKPMKHNDDDKLNSGKSGDKITRFKKRENVH